MISVASLGQASKNDSLLVIEDNLIMNSFKFTGNPAFLWTIPLPQYGRVNLNGQVVSGNFKRPMQAEKISQVKATADGWKKINNIGYLGSFEYKKNYEQNIGWSAVYEPYEGNPFIWVDSSTGNWDRDHIRANIAVAGQAFKGRIQSGIQLDYQIGSGARTSDPKPFYIYRNILLKPGIVLKLSEKSSLGLVGGASFILENNELGYYNRGTNNVLLYRLRGYGTFSRVPFVSGERKRQGSVWSAGTHFIKQFNTFTLTLKGNADITQERVTEGISIPEPIGKFKELKWETGISTYFGNVLQGKSINLGLSSQEGTGRDVIFQADNAIYSHATLTVCADWWKSNKLLKTTNHGSLLLTFSDYSQKDKAIKGDFNFQSASINALWTYRKFLSKNYQLYIEPNTGYCHILGNEYTTQSDNTILSELIRKDYRFLASSYFEERLIVKLIVYPERKSYSHSFSGLLTYKKATGTMAFNDRRQFELGYTLIF